MSVTRIQVTDRATELAFGRPLVVNSLRSMIVEAIVEAVLPNGWSWCAGDWSGWDFVHVDSTRLEAKQSAALQTWVTAENSFSKPIFGIAASKGFYEGSVWRDDPGRKAHIYVFAFHPVRDRNIADHREPHQWEFYVVATSQLPANRTISLPRLRGICSAVPYQGAEEKVEQIRQSLSG